MPTPAPRPNLSPSPPPATNQGSHVVITGDRSLKPASLWPARQQPHTSVLPGAVRSAPPSSRRFRCAVLDGLLVTALWGSIYPLFRETYAPPSFRLFVPFVFLCGASPTDLHKASRGILGNGRFALQAAGTGSLRR